MRFVRLPRVVLGVVPGLLTACPNDTTPSDTGSDSTSTATSVDDSSSTSATSSDPDSSSTTDTPDPSTSSGESSSSTSTATDPSSSEDDSSTSSSDATGSSTDDSSSSESATDTDTPVCGDAIADPGEDCDGQDLAGADCVSEGYVGGELGCTDQCAFDFVACVQQVCGNGVREGDEACDGDDFGGATCASLGEGDGALACIDDCSFDVSGCDASCNLGAVEVEFESLGDFVNQGDAWQAFTADTTGEIVQVDFYWNVGGLQDSFTMNIYQGVGTGGALLHSEVFPGQGNGNWVGFDTNVLSTSVPIAAGSSYTIEGVDTFGWQTANGGIPGAPSSVGDNQHKNIRVSVAPCIADCNLGAPEVEFESLGDFVNQGDAWQAFTADTTGEIVEVDFYWNVGGVQDSFTMNIYEGVGTGGALLHSELFPGQGQGNWVGFDTNILSTSVPITAGASYTVQGVDTFGWQTANGAILGAPSSVGADQHKNIRVFVAPCD